MERSIKLVFQEYKQLSDLNDSELQLVKAAIEARNSAYAPYSKYKVGAAVRMQNGEVVKASNQENVAYPSGLCAERVALFAAATTYPDHKIMSMAVYAENMGGNEDDPISPCGACRQVLMEYEQKQASPVSVVLSSDKGKSWVFHSVSTLLPFAFGCKN